jgi:hypothetical protein
LLAAARAVVKWSIDESDGARRLRSHRFDRDGGGARRCALGD